jgi:hypothetical protein
MKRLAAIVLLTACNQGTPAPNPGATVAATPARAQLSVAADDLRRMGEPSPRFSIPATNALLFRFDVPGMPESIGWVTLRLYTPSGTLHQTLHLPFSAGGTRTQIASPEGMPHPIDVLPAMRSATGFQLVLTLPVGGTHLERRPLVGTWRATATLDGHPESSASVGFDFTLQ